MIFTGCYGSKAHVVGALSMYVIGLIYGAACIEPEKEIRPNGPTSLAIFVAGQASVGYHTN